MEIAICDDDELFNEIMSEKLSTVLNKNQIKYNITPFFNGYGRLSSQVQHFLDKNSRGER